MLLNFGPRKGFNVKGISEGSKILFIYRYLSLLITSIFYLLNGWEHTITKKIYIIGCLTISAVILSYLYLLHEESNRHIKILLLIEIIGNSLLLIPSGGINSPFIWYTFNTILVSSIYLKRKYYWVNIILYVLGFKLIGYFRPDHSIKVFQLVRDEPNLVLSFIMIMAAIYVWSVFVGKTKDKSKEVQEINKQLKESNEMIIESMDYISALYQSINILNNQGNKEGSIKLLFQYIKEITETDSVFYYDISEDKDGIILDSDKYLGSTLKDDIKKKLKDILKHKEPMEIILHNTKFITVTLKSNYGNYGVLGLESTNSENNIIYKNNIYQIRFLSQLISVAFDRFYLEEVNERLLITEEQNRIANEIHDSVLQRLFSMSCGIFSLIKKLDKCTITEIEGELNQIRSTTNNVMKELRAKIYGLSWKKFGNNSFIMDIKTYIDDIRKFSNINIPFYILGNDELLSHKHKEAIYRMICEGIGNAVRHGNASNIEVSLKIDSNTSLLKIIDDGIGFDVGETVEDRDKGLGIQNLYQLTESLEGEISIHSKVGMGTKIEVIIPNNLMKMKGEKVTI